MSRVMPRRSLKIFTLLECIYELGGSASYEEVVADVGNLSSRGSKHEFMKMFQRGIDAGYFVLINNKYKLCEDAKNHVISTLKMEGSYKPKDTVLPAYKNIFTPEMKGYEFKLFRNKRGYENGFK